MSSGPDECARQVLETIPLVMRVIRAQMRSHRVAGLSVPQFRALIFLNRHEGGSLSDVAGHVGLMLPSMSRMIDGLVARDLVMRQVAAADRRRVELTLTSRGRAAMRSAYESTQAHLSKRLAALPEPDRTIILKAMQALASIFGSRREATNAAGG
ncbi:MAG TPA: MarR family winged helix-turn-helix transcriptional regulator [Syntrophobacteria bacterium]|nr:MarR family winged helix-turn-helix transcriptional regulator [Syntrophobacteria bacterium]